jgi:hypothetical protein
LVVTEPSFSPRFRGRWTVAVALCVAWLGLAGGGCSKEERADESAPPSAPWRFEILDESDIPTPARVTLHDSAGQSLDPLDAVPKVDYFGHTYFYTNGSFSVDTGEQRLRITVHKGFEYEPLSLELERGEDLTRLRLARAFDMKARGYYCGDGHVHPFYNMNTFASAEGVHFSPRAFVAAKEHILLQMRAEGLNLANLLAANTYGGKVFHRNRITGQDEFESRRDFIVRFSEEYRSDIYGHMSAFGVSSLSWPVFTAFKGTDFPFDFPTNYEATLKYRDAGVFASFGHLRQTSEKALECPIDVALGTLNAVEVQGYAVIASQARHIWEMLMSAGFDVVVTAGTDVRLARERSAVLGGARSYVDMKGLPFSYEGWTRRLSRGRSFTTNGPLLFLRVDGEEPGGRISLDAGERRTVEVEVVVDSVVAWDRAVVRMNRRNALEFQSAPDAPLHQVFRANLELEGPGWLYAHVEGGETRHLPRPKMRNPVAAITNAIWVDRGEDERRDPKSLEFFIRWVDANLDTLERRDNFGSPENRRIVHETFLAARKVFEERLADATASP